MAIPLLIPALAAVGIGTGGVVAYNTYNVNDDVQSRYEHLVDAKSTIMNIETPKLVFTTDTYSMSANGSDVQVNPEVVDLENEDAFMFTLTHELCHIKLGHLEKMVHKKDPNFDKVMFKIELEAEKCALKNSTRNQLSAAVKEYKVIMARDDYKKMNPVLSLEDCFELYRGFIE